MADTTLAAGAATTNPADSIRLFSAHGKAKPFYNFGTSDFTDQRLCEASAICHIFETGLRGNELGEETEVECLIPEIRADALNAISTLIELALLNLRWDQRGFWTEEAGQ